MAPEFPEIKFYAKILKFDKNFSGKVNDPDVVKVDFKIGSHFPQRVWSSQFQSSTKENNG